jgi:DNA processing protein
VVVVSGAAKGVDTASHKGCIEGHGETWAFLGEPLDALNGHTRAMHDLILRNQGTVFAELPPGARTEATKSLPRRNRLISGSSDLTVIGRAPEPSGALITATYAEEQGRPMLAIPGELHATSAVASNALLREKRAGFCFGVFDIFDAIGLPRTALMPEPVRQLAELPEGLSPEALKVAGILSGQPMDYDALLAASELTSGQLSARRGRQALLPGVIST